MYAVIKTGGKQYRVAQGDRLKVELLAGDVGGKVNFDALLVGGEGEAKVGAPVVAGAAVEGQIVAHGKHKKVIHRGSRLRKAEQTWLTKRDRALPATAATRPGSTAA